MTQQTHKITAKGAKPRIYEPAELKAARQLFRDHLARHRPEAPLEGPVELYVVWCYPATKTHPAGTWKTTKPDTDNLIKLVKDEMTRLGFWLDDAQVCMELNAKCYDRISGVSFRIRSMTECCSPGEDRDPGDEVCERSHTLLAEPEPKQLSAEAAEFRRLMSLPNCNDCAAKRVCPYCPGIGETVRINCPHYMVEPQKGGNES